MNDRTKVIVPKKKEESTEDSNTNISVETSKTEYYTKYKNPSNTASTTVSTGNPLLDGLYNATIGNPRNQHYGIQYRGPNAGKLRPITSNSSNGLKYPYQIPLQIPTTPGTVQDKK